jgi:DNA-binding MurR/RpiR family transcriptional regulator
MPYAAHTLALAGSGIEAGTRIVAITDSLDAPLAALADETLLAATANQHFFASQLGALYLFETIIGLMVAKSGTGIQGNLRKSESFSRQHGEYVERD